MFYDHDIIQGSFNNSKVYDLTHYPKTLNPLDAPKASLNTLSIQEKLEIIGSTDTIDKSLSNTIFFKTELYTPTCPLSTLNKSSTLTVDV